MKYIFKKNGWTLIELMVVIGIISVLALIAVPNFSKYRKRGFNTSALHSGEVAKDAQERYYNYHYSYANSLAELLQYDKNITKDPQVTFKFKGASSSGYTFTVSHKKGDKEIVFKQD